MTTLPDTNDKNWERQTLEKLAFSALNEQRAKRRWGIFFRLAGFAYLLVLLVTLMGWLPDGGDASSGKRHTALINVSGVIDSEGDSSAERLLPALRSAFEDKNTVGVILRINSPGGSPVQSGIIFDEIRRQRSLHKDIPVYAVVEDICASGAYYIAAGADKIYANPSSLIGSIGVIMNGFGFTESMKKLGVERRLMTAGKNKGFMDPFSPVNANQQQHAQTLLDELHQQFIGAVRQGRGERLHETPDTFSGLIWSGSQSIQMGLADELGTVNSVAREVIKVEKIVDFSVRENLAERFAKRLGASAAASFGQVLLGGDNPVR